MYVSREEYQEYLELKKTKYSIDSKVKEVERKYEKKIYYLNKKIDIYSKRIKNFIWKFKDFKKNGGFSVRFKTYEYINYKSIKEYEVFIKSEVLSKGLVLKLKRIVSMIFNQELSDLKAENKKDKDKIREIYHMKTFYGLVKLKDVKKILK